MRGEAWLWFVRGGGFLMGAAIAFGLIYTMVMGARVVVLVFIALLLASGLEPLIDRVRRSRSPLGRGATLLLVYAGFFATVAALLLFVLPSAIDQFGALGTRLTPLLNEAREWARTLDRGLSLAVIGLIDTVQKAFAPREVTVPDPEELIALGLTFAEIVITLASLLTLVYFWLTERARLQRFALALLPYERRAGAREAWNEIEVRLGAWVRGQLILMGSVGVATSIAYFLIGLEGALLLGLFAALCEVIPIIGPALGAVPALIVAALTGRIEVIILVAVVYFIIQVVEGNILVPLVMHNTIGVPPFLVFVSILGGAAVAGIPGALVSVPLVAAVLVLVERLQARDTPVPLSGQPPPEQIPEVAEAVERLATEKS